MANHLTNDKGETIIACGAEGSQARMFCQYPKLIQHLKESPLVRNDKVYFKEYLKSFNFSLMELSSLWEIIIGRYAN